jgi:hypothetical protein
LIALKKTKLKRDDYLFSEHALLLEFKTGLDVLETFPDDFRIQSDDIFAFCKSFWQEILENDFANFISLRSLAKINLAPTPLGSYQSQVMS